MKLGTAIRPPQAVRFQFCRYVWRTARHSCNGSLGVRACREQRRSETDMRSVRVLIARGQSTPFTLVTPRVSIQCVGNVRDLLKALANEPPGVLVLDRDMPGIGGLAGARDLQ